MTSPELQSGVPFITTAQMREVDRLMVEEYGIELLQMMENAGRNLARAARTLFLSRDPRGQRIAVVSGNGGNGGGGMVAARRLAAWGGDVDVWISADPSRLSEAAAHQYRALLAMDVTVNVADDSAPPDLGEPVVVLDAVLGYSLSGSPRGGAASLVRAVNACAAPVLSLDVPSGVESTTGDTAEPAVRADATLTLALPKTGLKLARENVGDLYLTDIGVPPELYARRGLDLTIGPLFYQHEILRIW